MDSTWNPVICAQGRLSEPVFAIGRHKEINLHPEQHHHKKTVHSVLRRHVFPFLLPGFKDFYTFWKDQFSGN